MLYRYMSDRNNNTVEEKGMRLKKKSLRVLLMTKNKREMKSK